MSTSAEFGRYFAADGSTFAVRWAFRKKKRERRLKLDAYIRGIRALDMAAHRILGTHTREINPNAKVVIAFGSARFNGTKGSPSAPTKRLHQRLSTLHRQSCIVADVDEFRTSKMCPKSGSKVCNVREAKAETKAEMKQGVVSSLICSLKAAKCVRLFSIVTTWALSTLLLLLNN